MANLKDLVVNGNSSFVGNVRNNGALETKGKMYVHNAPGIGGSTGYIKIAQIKIKTIYQDVPIEMEIMQRRSSYSSTLYITFTNENSADPTLSVFRYFGETINAQIVKSATSTWDLYVWKKESYDGIHVVRYHTKSTDGTDVIWTNEQVDTPPTGAVKAIVATFNLKSTLAGGSDYANSLHLNPSSRQTSANLDLTNPVFSHNVTYMLNTTTMKEGKPPSANGYILTFGWDSNVGWGAQLAIADASGDIYTRLTKNVDSKPVWETTWKTFLNSSNYNNYAPTKTGGGASGTWGIGISGNAATATKLATKRTIALSGDVTGSGTFDGSANLTINAKLANSNAGGLSYRIDNVTFAKANWTMDSTRQLYKYTYSNANITESTVVNVMFAATSLPVANDAGVQQEVIEGNGNITIYSNSIPTADLVADVLIYGAVTSEALTPDAQTSFSNQMSTLNSNVTTLKNSLGSTKVYWSLAEVNNTLTVNSTMETVFNAMQAKSVLYCVIDGTNSVYPSAKGILNIVKIDANNGTAQFQYDGKIATGSFTA